MLLIAASLAGELPVTLGRLLGGLDRRNIGNARSTLRSYQEALRAFCGYLIDPAY
jgi:hypothetical protein